MAASTDLLPDVAERELVITRVFDAPRALVFKAWTEADRAAMWWGPRECTIESCRMDARVGGRWRIVLRGPEGTRHVKSGVYKEVVPPERLVFTFAWEDEAGHPKHEILVRLTFAEEGGRTRLTLHHTNFESRTARDLHHDGWSSTVERFAAFLASELGRRQ